ncbi:MAG: M28 family peptidase [Acidobacteriota bacterium]
MDTTSGICDDDTVNAAVAAIQLEEPWNLVERFTGWVRESGSEDERKAATYIVERLRSFGLEPQIYEPELYLSVPRSATVEVLDGGTSELPCKTPAFSASTGDGGVEGELVGIASDRVKTTSELFTASARVDASEVGGKVVLVEGYAMPKIVRQIEDAGATAAIFINPGHAHEGIVTTIWGTPSLKDRHKIPQLVVVSVPESAGAELRHGLANGGCRVRVSTELFRGWAACPLVVAEIPGKSADFVLLHGHYDSWHVGIGDNAVGNAALLEVARAVNTVSERLWRGVRVAWWPGHSTGRYGGSTWYADNFAMDLRDHCVAQIDVDSPGCRWATAYDEVMWMQEASEFAAQTIQQVTGVTARGIRPLRAGDYSFNNLGLTGFFMLLSNIPAEVAERQGFYPVGGCGGNSDAWHTEEDTLEVADRENLERDIRVYLAAVTRLATAAFLPFDYRLTVQEIADWAREYGDYAQGNFDTNPVLEECRALHEELQRFYQAAAALAVATGSDEGPQVCQALYEALAPYDRTQIGLARELVPINYTAAPRYAHDPALETPPLPDLAMLRLWPQLEGDDDGRRFLLAEALRGRNRVTDAIRRARERVAAAITNPVG